MSALLTILKALGLALLGLLALLIALLFVPVSARVSYERSRLTLKAGALGLWFEIFDSDKKREPKAEKQAGAPEPPESEPEAGAASEFDFELVKTLLGAGGRAAARVLRGLRIRHISLVLVARGFDPYETGVKTGRIWAGIGAALALLRSVWRNLGVDRLVVIPDFMNQHAGGESAGFEISARGITFVCAGCIVGWRYIKYIINKRREARESLNPERTCLQ